MSTPQVWEPVALDGGQRTAIIHVTPAGSEEITYQSFLAAREQLARSHEHVLGPGKVVGILAENTIDWLIAYYATIRAGGVVVPISHKLPAAGLEYVIRDANLDVLFVDHKGRRAVGGIQLGDVPLLDLDAIERPADSELQSSPEDFAPSVRDLEELAIILYTSGSTGYPKGVELPLRQPKWVIGNMGRAVGSRDSRLLIAAPLYHMNALLFAAISLHKGATAVMLSGFEPELFLRAIERHQVTIVSGVPPMFAMLKQHVSLVQELDLSSVQAVMMGSAPASDDLLRTVEEWFPSALVMNAYGTSESGPGVFGPHPDGLPTPLGSVGVGKQTPIVRLVDESGEVTQRYGILQVKSPALMLGYHNRPDIELPVTADGFHHTKDLFEVDDNGFYYFRGRADDMFVSGGENIHPRSVESVLESHPSVVDAAVVPVPDEYKGVKPVAFVSLHAGAALNEEGLKQHVLQRLEPFAHPRRIWAVDALPLSSTNKVDKAALSERARELLGIADGR